MQRTIVGRLEQFIKNAAEWPLFLFFYLNFCGMNFCLNACSSFFNSVVKFEMDVREISCSGARLVRLIILVRSLPNSTHAVFKNVSKDIWGFASYLSMARRNAKRRASKDCVPM